jgi:hypothetical protein
LVIVGYYSINIKATGMDKLSTFEKEKRRGSEEDDLRCVGMQN